MPSGGRNNQITFIRAKLEISKWFHLNLLCFAFTILKDSTLWYFWLDKHDFVEQASQTYTGNQIIWRWRLAIRLIFLFILPASFFSKQMNMWFSLHHWSYYQTSRQQPTTIFTLLSFGNNASFLLWRQPKFGYCMTQSFTLPT